MRFPRRFGDQQSATELALRSSEGGGGDIALHAPPRLDDRTPGRVAGLGHGAAPAWGGGQRVRGRARLRPAARRTSATRSACSVTPTRRSASAARSRPVCCSGSPRRRTRPRGVPTVIDASTGEGARRACTGDRKPAEASGRLWPQAPGCADSWPTWPPRSQTARAIPPPAPIPAQNPRLARTARRAREAGAERRDDPRPDRPRPDGPRPRPGSAWTTLPSPCRPPVAALPDGLRRAPDGAARRGHLRPGRPARRPPSSPPSRGALAAGGGGHGAPAPPVNVYVFLGGSRL